SPEKLQQLATSVKEKGVLEPILVRPKNGNDDRYEVVAGERRLRAAQLAELEQVPCVVKDLTDSEAFEIAIVENLQREDLNPVEETEAILDFLSAKLKQPRNKVISHFQIAQQQVRHPEEDISSPEFEVISDFLERIGRFTPNSFRTNRLPLLKLPDDIFAAISEGQIEYSKGKLIAKGVKDQVARQELLKDAINDHLSRDVIQQRIKELKRSTAGLQSTNTLIDRTKTVLKKVTKAHVWEDVEKRKQLEFYLCEIEKLMS
ncbi:MAG: ParB/RepB/Spo0J family partition protein, partial [Elainellaceae cyanobacterium]